MTAAAKNLDTRAQRAQRALESFQGLEVIHFYDLPSGIGWKTMKLLVERGLVEVVDAGIGIYATDFTWRLVQRRDAGA